MGDQEAGLPKATLAKLIKDHMPENFRASAEAIALLQSCCSEFIQLIYTEAVDLGTKEKKNTVIPEHVMKAVENLELSQYSEDLKAYYEEWKESAKGKPRMASKKKSEKSDMSEEELVQLQQKMFSESRARSANLG